MVAALLLALCEVQDEAIAADYVASDRHLTALYAAWASREADPEKRAGLICGFVSKPEHILVPLKDLRRTGGVETYARRTGVSHSELQAIKKRLCGEIRQVRAVIARLLDQGVVTDRSNGKLRDLFPVAISAREGEALREWVMREDAASTIGYGSLRSSLRWSALEQSRRRAPRSHGPESTSRLLRHRASGHRRGRAWRHP